jgi:hypothetical protein
MLLILRKKHNKRLHTDAQTYAAFVGFGAGEQGVMYKGK